MEPKLKLILCLVPQKLNRCLITVNEEIIKPRPAIKTFRHLVITLIRICIGPIKSIATSMSEVAALK